MAEPEQRGAAMLHEAAQSVLSGHHILAAARMSTSKIVPWVTSMRPAMYNPPKFSSGSSMRKAGLALSLERSASLAPEPSPPVNL